MEENIRMLLERQEHSMLSRYASFSDCSRGRAREEEPCDIRPVYQRDRDRIIHCKAFRRLKDKTQVFLIPKGDHYRTRLTHTLEVSQIARSICKALQLNEDLTEAIALGHDLGHTPFGHAGERALNAVFPGGFRHYEQSLRVVDRLEKDGKGLNLTYEVRDGIRNHQLKTMPCTMEGKIVRLSDKIAYLNHDIDDAVRGHIIEETDIPKELRAYLGNSLTERLNTFIHDLVMTSRGKAEIALSPEAERAMLDLKRYMFESVYTNPVAKGEEGKAEAMVKYLYEYYCEHPEKLPEENRLMIGEGEQTERCVADYIAGMTDKYAVESFKSLCIPKAWGIY